MSEVETDVPDLQARGYELPSAESCRVYRPDCYEQMISHCPVSRARRARGVVEDPQMIDNPAAYMEKAPFYIEAALKERAAPGQCSKKGAFEAFSSRNPAADSSEVQDCFITKLKASRRAGARGKRESRGFRTGGASMFTDMALSDQLQEEYMKGSHSGSPGGVIHEVRVLQTNAWPEKADDAPVIPCPEMTTCITAYEAFYNSKHNGRKLRWIYNMGSVELKCYGLARPHILVVSAYQCLALVLFNKRQQVTLREICEATKLPEEESRRQVTSLTVSRHKVLLHDATGKDLGSETKLQVNDKFSNDKVKVAVSLIKKEEKAETTTLAEAPVERKHVIDAAIVRIMKSRNRLEHNSLLDEVFRQCTLFKPQPAQIKSQIEHLIEREFLKRDDANRSIYLYLRRSEIAQQAHGECVQKACSEGREATNLQVGCAAFPPGLHFFILEQHQLKREEKMAALLDAKTAGLMQYMLLGEHC
ncbi:CUL3A [Symbiodinium sp. CCMP2592]|nr:CUL3A [Symbiodinium sp. CCMP2592]